MSKEGENKSPEKFVSEMIKDQAQLESLKILVFSELANLSGKEYHDLEKKFNDIFHKEKEKVISNWKSHLKDADSSSDQ